MNITGMIKGLAVSLAVVGFCVPQPVWALGQADESPAVTDVTLQKGSQGNVLVGRVLDQQGAVRADLPVVLYRGGKKLAEGKTGRDGYFAFANLQGGVYQLTASGGVGACRVWTPGTAPPSAQQGILIVAGTEVVRGQTHPFRHTAGGARFWLSHPCVIAGLVAAAVAIPIVILTTHEHKPKSPC